MAVSVSDDGNLMEWNGIMMNVGNGNGKLGYTEGGNVEGWEQRLDLYGFMGREGSFLPASFTSTPRLLDYLSCWFFKAMCLT